MKIINLKEFRQLPAGVLFMKYEPCVFEDLQAKGKTLEGDFVTENITYWPDCNGSGDMVDKLEEAEKTDKSILLDFDACGRDGCFEKDQLFAVYDKRDVEMLMDKLNRCLVSAYT
ncbi:MAG: hypothetical protein AB1Y25_12245 [Cycloclasticus sp.]